MASLIPENSRKKVKMRAGTNQEFDLAITIKRPIGEGGMAQVYLVDRPTTSSEIRLVAMKVIDSALLLRNGSERARFGREIEVAKSLAHPNIARFIDWGEMDGVLFYFTEYIEGSVLSDIIDGAGCTLFPANPGVEGSRLASLEECSRRYHESVVHPLNIWIIMESILNALAHLHSRGIVHRDLKPDNVMVSFDQEGQIKAVKVLDFGIAKMLDRRTNYTETGTMLGTVKYMAPEQMAATKNVGPVADLYSAGLMMLELITGRTVANVDPQNPLALCIKRVNQQEVSFDPAEYVDGLSEEVRAVVLKATAFNPEERFQSASDMLLALAKAYGMEYRMVAFDHTIEQSSDVLNEGEIGSLPTQLATAPVSSRPESTVLAKSKNVVTSIVTAGIVMLLLSIGSYMTYLVVVKKNPDEMLQEVSKQVKSVATAIESFGDAGSVPVAEKVRTSSVLATGQPSALVIDLPVPEKMSRVQKASFDTAQNLIRRNRISKGLEILLRLETDGVRDPELFRVIAYAYRRKGDTKKESVYASRARGAVVP